MGTSTALAAETPVHQRMRTVWVQDKKYASMSPEPLSVRLFVRIKEVFN